jgi:hypothetical protein
MRLVSAFPSVDAEVASEVCPLFFRLGQPDALAVRARCLETIDPWRNGQGIGFLPSSSSSRPVRQLGTAKASATAA